MALELLVPSGYGAPGSIAERRTYDLLSAELGEALGEPLATKELPLRDIAPAGVTLIHTVENLVTSPEAAGEGRFRTAIFLAVRPDDVDDLLAVFAPAGLVDIRALAFWQRGANPYEGRSGIVSGELFRSRTGGRAVAWRPLPLLPPERQNASANPRRLHHLAENHCRGELDSD